MLFKVKTSIKIPEEILEDICNVIENDGFTFYSVYRDILDSYDEKEQYMLLYIEDVVEEEVEKRLKERK